ncbi:preprotein translocase subunit YajC [Corynebacterium caspium]|uniref:preprotein translocase subunit YajC n=1 Tax=Corynebacterium caspium TaxID=234828 RepID=UPI0012E9BB0B|nr:preprotein translocase subunit YajC [Corynebacterium caspium]
MNSLMLIIVTVGFLILITLNNRKISKKRAEILEMQNSITTGSQVITVAGLHGTVSAVDAETVSLMVAPGVETVWEKTAIASIISPITDEQENTEANNFETGEPTTTDPTN